MGMDYKRNSAVLNKKFFKITVPTVIAELCTILCVAIDSIVAQHYIDNRSVAAIALLVTFMTTFQVLHDLFGSCTTILITRKKCEISNQEASRTLADLIAVIFPVFCAATIIIFIFGKGFLHFLASDNELVNLAWTYYLPILFISPVQEVLLIIERGYKTEGNVVYFAARPIITNVFNILLDLLFVAVLHKGIIWLAFATVISNLIGYSWSLSYPLFRQCNIRPDFKGLFKKGRLKNTIKEELDIGNAYFFGDIIDLINAGLISKLIFMFGGSIGMVSYGIIVNIRSMTDGFVFPVLGNATIFASALHSEKDRKGLHTIVKTTLKALIFFTGACLLVMILFPDLIGFVYDVTDSKQLQSMRLCLCTFGFCVFWGAIAYFIRTFLISIKKERLSTVLSIIQRVLQLGLMLLASLTGSIVVIWIALGWSSFIFVVGFLLYNKKKKVVDDVLPDYDTSGYSCKLRPGLPGEISEAVYKDLREKGISVSICAKIGLIIEECSSIIVNENGFRPVNADIRVRISDKEIKVFFYYDGKIIMRDEVKIEKSEKSPENLEFIIIYGLTKRIKRVLVVQLNCVEFTVKNP